MYDTLIERRFDTEAEKAVELDVQAQLDRILHELKGIWNLPDLAAPTYLYIRSVEDGGEQGVATTISISDGYFPEKLSRFIDKHHDLATLRHLTGIINAHIRSRLAQLGLDGKLEEFIWRENGLAVKVRMYSRSCRSIQIKTGEKIVTLFTTVGSKPIDFTLLTDVCWYTTSGQDVVSFTKAVRGYDYNLMTAKELSDLISNINFGLAPKTELALVRLNQDWKVVAENRNPILMPLGEHSNEFRCAIDAQLKTFETGEARFLVGETHAHLSFPGRALLRSEIIGFHRKTRKVLKLKQTNSPCMGNTFDWSIRVEVTTVDGSSISAVELAEYDFYMLLQFFEAPSHN